MCAFLEWFVSGIFFFKSAMVVPSGGASFHMQAGTVRQWKIEKNQNSISLSDLSISLSVCLSASHTRLPSSERKRPLQLPPHSPLLPPNARTPAITKEKKTKQKKRKSIRQPLQPPTLPVIDIPRRLLRLRFRLRRFLRWLLTVV